MPACGSANPPATRGYDPCEIALVSTAVTVSGHGGQELCVSVIACAVRAGAGARSRRMRRRPSRVAAAVVSLLVLPLRAVAAVEDLADLSLRELSEVEVTSVSKTAE